MSSIDLTKLSGVPVIFSFEKNFNATQQVKWTYDNWTITIYLSLAYIVLVFTGQHLMKDRKPFDLRLPLILWSAGLALFSFFGSLRTVPELFSVLVNNGFMDSVCKNSYTSDIRIKFWFWLFIWSKIVELGDTVFIVLRKQKLIFLHWIHHALTMCFGFFILGDMAGFTRWFAAMNYSVHVLMYTYYTLKAMKIPVPKSIAVVITSLQIIQMIMGLFVSIIAFSYNIFGLKCRVSFSVSAFAVCIYSLFLMLFVNFFLKSYLIPPEKVNKKN